MTSTFAPPVPSLSPPTRHHWLARPNAPLRVAMAGLGIGLLGRWALGGDALGFGFTVWTAAAVLGFLALSGAEARRRARRARWWAMAAVVFSGWVAVRDSPELAAFNVLTVLGLLLLALHDSTGEAERQGFGDYLRHSARASTGTVVGVLTLVREGGRQVRAGRGRGVGAVGGVLRGLLLATPVVVVMGALLTSADKNFDRALSRLFDGTPKLLETGFDWGLSTVVLGGLTAGAWVYALRRRALEAAHVQGPPTQWIGATEGVVVLGSVAMLFVGFLVVQLQTLFGLDPSERGTGLTYAEYARDGFGELTFVAALTWGVVSLSQRWVRTTAASSAVIRVLGAGLLGLAVVLVASAHTRLSLYEETYGFTVRRVFAHAGIVWLAACLVIRAATLFVAARRCADWMVAAALAVLCGLNALNPDAFVVTRNLARPTDVVSLDWYYLLRLSHDATPALADSAAPDWARREIERRCRRGVPTLAGLSVAKARLPSCPTLQ